MKHDSNAKLFLVAENDRISKIFLPSIWNEYRETCLNASLNTNPATNYENHEQMKKRRRVFAYEPEQSDISSSIDPLVLPMNLARIAIKNPVPSSMYDEPPMLIGSGVMEEINLLKRDIFRDLHFILQTSRKYAAQFAYLSEHFEFCLGTISLYYNESLSHKLDQVVDGLFACEIQEPKKDVEHSSQMPSSMKAITTGLSLMAPPYKGVESDAQGPQRYECFTIPTMKKQCAHKMDKSEKDVQKILAQKVGRPPKKEDWIELLKHLDQQNQSEVGTEYEETHSGEDQGLNNAGIDREIRMSLTDMYQHIIKTHQLNHDIASQVEHHLQIAFALADDPGAIEKLRKQKQDVQDYKREFISMSEKTCAILQEKMEKKSKMQNMWTSLKLIWEYFQVAAFDMRKQFAVARHIVLSKVSFSTEGSDMYKTLQQFTTTAWGAILKTPTIGKQISKFCVNENLGNVIEYLRIVSSLSQGKNLFHSYLSLGTWWGKSPDFKFGTKLFIYDVVRDGDLSDIKNAIVGKFHLESSLIYGGVNSVANVFSYILNALKNSIAKPYLFIYKFVKSIPVVSLVFNLSGKVSKIVLKAPVVYKLSTCFVAALTGTALQLAYLTVPGKNLTGKLNEIVDNNIKAFTQDIEETKRQIKNDSHLLYEVDYLTSASYFEDGWFGLKNQIDALTCYADLANELTKNKDVIQNINTKSDLKNTLNSLMRRHKKSSRKLEFQQFKEKYDACEYELRRVSTAGFNLKGIRSAILAPYRIFDDNTQKEFRNKLLNVVNTFTDVSNTLAIISTDSYNFPVAEETAWRVKNTDATEYLMMKEEVDKDFDQIKYDKEVEDRAKYMKQTQTPLYRKFLAFSEMIPPLKDHNEVSYKGEKFASIESLRKKFENDRASKVLLDVMLKYSSNDNNDDHDYKLHDEFNWKEVYKLADNEIFEELKQIVTKIEPSLQNIAKSTDYILEDAYFIPRGTANQVVANNEEMQAVIDRDYIAVNTYWYSKEMLLNLPRLKFIISLIEYGNRKMKDIYAIGGHVIDASYLMLESGVNAAWDVLTLDGTGAWNNMKKAIEAPIEAGVKIADYDIWREGYIGKITGPVANMVEMGGGMLGYSYDKPKLLQRAERSIWPSEYKIIHLKKIAQCKIT
tara:strand:- start:2831 stop:6238 length:3408 start_codon:yes stop_codon:yes gene_type:complete